MNTEHLLAFQVEFSQAKQPVPSIHLHGEHELVYINEGTGMQFTGETGLRAQKGDLFFFPAKTLHSASCPETNERMEMIVIMIPEKMFLGSPDALLFLEIISAMNQRAKQAPKLSLTDDKESRELIHNILMEFTDRRPGYNSAARSLFMNLLIKLYRNQQLQPFLSSEHTDNVNRQKIDETCRFLAANYGHRHTIDELAGKAAFSRSHFQSLFRKYTGVSVSEYLTEIRIKTACRLLEKTGRTVLEISQDTGFATPSYFTDTFKRTTGTTPSAYRRQLGSGNLADQ